MRNFICILFIVPFWSCNSNGRQNAVDLVDNVMPLNYVEVGKVLDSVPVPYVIDVSKNSKRLVFIGCEHQQDSTHLQYKIIEDYYKELYPEVSFNEGGQVHERYISLNEAIRKDGETGANKFLADKFGIKLLNGDTPDSLEFALNAIKNDTRKLFVYYIIERMVIPYKYGAYGEVPFESFYNRAIDRWFENYPLPNSEKTFEKFKCYYKEYTGNTFLLNKTHSSYAQDSLDVEAFDYVNDSCEFCAIGRSSKMLRDSILLVKLREAFKTHDRILVTFGHGHALALEPALRGIFK